MGEAKRRADLGPTRKIRVTRGELLELTGYLLRPDAEGRPRNIDRAERKALKRAFRQTGAHKIWDIVLMNPKGIAPAEEVKKVVPETQVVEVTVDTIEYLLKALGDIPVQAGLTLVELEEKLEDAKAGINLVVDEEEEKPETDVDQEKKDASLEVVS